MNSSPPSTDRWTVDLSLRQRLEGGAVLAGVWACDGTTRTAQSEDVPAYHQIWLQRVGSQVVEMGGCRVIADAASAVLQNPGEEVRAIFTPGVAQVSTVVWIREAALRDLLDTVAEPHDGGFSTPVAHLDADAALAHYRLRLLLRDRATSPLEVEEVTLRLLGGLLGAGAAGGAGSGTRASRAHRELVHAVQQLLSRRFADRILLDDVARAVGSSPFHLSRVFSLDVGMPIHRYLTRLRLFAALERMADGERDLSRVALAVGFSSHSHFTTTFRRELGRVPREVR